MTYTAKELQKVQEPHASAFVESQVGVDNVCERAALCAHEAEEHWCMKTCQRRTHDDSRCKKGNGGITFDEA